MALASPSNALKERINQVLSPYQDQICAWIQADIPKLGPKTPLRDACEYALLNGGKRLRPALVAMIAKALGFGADVSAAALAVEYFHTASLVVDDLPCMDDDDERRQKPTVHKVFGEAAALLVGYGLMAAGYERIAVNAQRLKDAKLPHSKNSDHLCVLALENATFNAGLWGATGGQFLDINPPELNQQLLLEIIHKKTGVFFEVSFVFGWLFGGGQVEMLPLVKKSAAHFGMAFQIADDVQDLSEDVENHRQVNVAAFLGRQQAMSLFEREMDSFHASLKQLDLNVPEFHAIGAQLIHQVGISH